MDRESRREQLRSAPRQRKVTYREAKDDALIIWLRLPVIPKGMMMRWLLCLICLVSIAGCEKANPESDHIRSSEPHSTASPAVSNPAMGELHELLVPAGFRVDTYGENLAWKKGDDAIYFEVKGSGDGQYHRELTVLTLFRGGRQIWSSHAIKIEEKSIWIQDENQRWVRVFDCNTGSVVTGADGFGAKVDTPASKLEAEYDGKPLSYWKVQATSGTIESREAAAKALGKMGPPAIPALIELLRDKEGNAWATAATALGEMGPPAIPALTKLLHDGNARVRMSAGAALEIIEAGGASEIVRQCFGNEGKRAPQETSPASKSEPEHDGKPLSYWEAQATSDSIESRRAAAAALAKIGPPAIPILIKLLRDKEENVSAAAATALGEMGPPAIPALVELLRDKEERVWTFASVALKTIGPAAIPALIELVRDRDKGVRWVAAATLVKIGPTAIPALIAMIHDADQSIRTPAATALVKIGPAAIPALTELLRDKEERVRASPLRFSVGSDRRRRLRRLRQPGRKLPGPLHQKSPLCRASMA